MDETTSPFIEIRDPDNFHKTGDNIYRFVKQMIRSPNQLSKQQENAPEFLLIFIFWKIPKKFSVGNSTLAKKIQRDLKPQANKQLQTLAQWLHAFLR